MTTLFWILEYSKVNIAYMILVFVWPSLLFKKYLKGKSLTFRLGFCSTASVLLLNVSVLLLGLVGLLKPWFFRLLFYGSLGIALYFAIPGKKEALKQAGRVIVGTFGVKQLFHTIGSSIFRRVKQTTDRVLSGIEGHKGEYALLGLVLLYGMIYFTHGAFQDYSYGFGDMYPHNAWIYGLTQGKVFSSGVYPEGMHCFVFSMHVLFGIRLYSCMLFLAGVHVLLFLLSAYCLLKELFCSRYTPILALALFLTIDVVSVDAIYSMSRLQWTIPQEFGLYTVFLCGTFLARYLRAPGQDVPMFRRAYNPLIRSLRKWVYNDDLLVFMMALAVSLSIHFYPTIMAFFLCVAFIPLAIRKIFQPSRLIPLFTAVVAGFFLAILPMGLALASGIPFQGSIGWAVNIINGTETDGQGAIIVDELTGEEITGDLSSLFNRKPANNQPGTDASGTTGNQSGTGTSGTTGSQSGTGTSQTTGNQSGTGTSQTTGNQSGTGTSGTTGNPSGTGTSGTTGSQSGTVTGGQTAVKEPFSIGKLFRGIGGLFKKILEKAVGVYWYAYVAIYKRRRAIILSWATAFTLLAFAGGRIATMIYAHRTGEKVRCDRFDGYLVLALGSMCFMTMYAASSIGLPALIAGSRLCSVIQILLMSVCLIPIDIVLYGLSYVRDSLSLTKMAWAAAFGIYLGTMLFGSFHGYLYYELTRYNGAVMVTQAITNKLPKYTYTIVSTVDELYPMIQFGYHEEAVKFVNDCVDNDYTLPSEYVFVFVEKHPIEYAQSHFFTGPKWLAWEKYPAYYHSLVSQCPHISRGTISPELAEAPFYHYPVSSKAYTELASRVVVESRLQRWCDKFDQLYPNTMHTYYEDENFICYYFRQNPACLYQLGIQ